MTAKSMRLATLPLLGSNQDSPDPESGAPLRVGGAAGRNGVGSAQIPAEAHTISPTIFHPRRRGGKRQVSCHVGHPLSGWNLIVCANGLRQCRTCKNARRRKGEANPRHLRLNAPGRVLARGPLDYDVPVTLRCASCGAIYERPLDAIGEPCPVCQRYPEAVA